MLRHCFAPLVAVLLASCASLPRNRGSDEFNALLDDRQHVALAGTPAEREAALADARDRLGRPLRLDDAVAIALARSPEVQRQLAELGLAYADLLEASRLSNPTLSVSALDPDRPGERTRVSLAIVQSFTDIIMLRSRSALARGELASAQQSAVRGIQTLIADVAEDYFDLVGAQQVAQMRGLVALAARNAATLAERFYAAGNLPGLEINLQQAEAVDAEIAFDEATADAVAARHALAIRIGLDAGDTFEVVDSLPVPVPTEDALDGAIELAYASRLDLTAARRRAEVLARALGVTRKFRWLGGFEVGYERERETDGSKLRGPSVSLQLPIFHQNQAIIARAQARVDLAEADAIALERGIGHEVRAAHAALDAVRRRAERYRTDLVPLREKVVACTQEQVNFMLVSQFDLIEAKRAEFDAYQDYLESLRDYWVARSNLSATVGRALPTDADIVDVDGVEATVLPEASAGMGGAGHDMSAMQAPGASEAPAGHDMSAMQAPTASDAPAGHDMSAMQAPAASEAPAGHDMATMQPPKSSDAPAGHDMAAMEAGQGVATCKPRIPLERSATRPPGESATGHEGHDMQAAPPPDPHAGHDMGAAPAPSDADEKETDVSKEHEGHQP